MAASDAMLAERMRLGLAIVRELYVLGKETVYTASVITGSSKRTVRFAHHKDLAELGMGNISAFYPNLNHSVFRDLRIEPLRTPEEFSMVFPLKTRDEHARMFFRTGGVGRYFSDEEAILPNRLPSDPGQLEIISRLVHLQQLLLSANQTVSLNDQAVLAFEAHPWHGASLLLSEAEGVLARHSRKDTPEARLQEAKALVMIAEDDGLLFEHHGAVSFLVPMHAVVYAKLLINYGSAADTKLAYAFQTVLVGVEGSLGSMLEAPILQSLVDKEALPHHSVHLVCRNRHLSFAGNAVNLLSPDGSSTAIIELPAFEVIRFNADMGADGFWVEPGTFPFQMFAPLAFNAFPFPKCSTRWRWPQCAPAATQVWCYGQEHHTRWRWLRRAPAPHRGQPDEI